MDDDDELGTAGVIGDMVEAIKRAPDAMRDEASKAIDRMRERYAEVQRAKALRLAVFLGAAYLLLKRSR